MPENNQSQRDATQVSPEREPQAFAGLQWGESKWLLIHLVLTLAALVCFWPITRHGFISIDDDLYITENPQVVKGLTWAGFVWAFTSIEACNWHPLTWLSHMLDCQLYGLNPAGHHFTNLLFHTLNTLLLFLLLKQMTGAVWRSAFAAALFAWHPLHVESVAWASERKDVLSAFFWLATLMSYVGYVRSPSRWRYFSTLLLFALGLMSKPMLVTLPFVLLLLDYWPLRRLSPPTLHCSLSPTLESAPASPPHPSSSQALRLLFEKLPFFALTLAASVVTYTVQEAGGAVSSLTVLPLHSRISNALVAYVRYLGKSVWPSDLAAMYPYPDHWPFVWSAGAVLMLIILSALCLRFASRQPCLLVGWLWFLGTLLPTIGLVQVGLQSMADRYMYIPSIGLSIMAVWGANELFAGWPRGRLILEAVGTVALIGCIILTRIQVSYWQNSEKLLRHAIDVTSGNYIAYDGLGSALSGLGREQEALTMCAEAVRLKPDYAQGQYDLGTVLLKQGKLEEAARHLDRALQLQPSFAEAHGNLGKILVQQGRFKEAEPHLAKAQERLPKNPQIQYNLGTVLFKQGKVEEAILHFSIALQLKPDYAEAHANLGIALMALGRSAEGAAHLFEALRLDPNDAGTAVNLGLALLELKKPDEAAARFSEALRLTPDSPRAHYFLALALVRQQKQNEALPHARKARDLAQAAGLEELMSKAELLLKTCESGEPSPSAR
jgi:tetratricopeptide (TPR) repeat protein